MKKKTKLVLSILKPKSKALGFRSDELEGIAADIANNLELDEEASDEDVNAEIEKQVDAVIPYLKIAQKQSNRVIQKFKDNKTLDDDINEENEINEAGSNKENQITETTPQWVKDLKDAVSAVTAQNKTLQTQIASLLSEREADGRRSRLKALLKDTDTFGKSVLRNFDRMKFENETEFEEFYDSVSEDLASLNQERANAGLAKLGASAAQGGNEHKDEKPEVLKETEIDDLANSL